MLLRCDVPEDAIALERLASNTSENFWLSAELLRAGGLDPYSFLAVTKPYGERRILSTARRWWPHKKVAVTSEETGFDQYLAGGITHRADPVGEALRLESYAAIGLIDPGDPAPVKTLDAAPGTAGSGFQQPGASLATRHREADLTPLGHPRAETFRAIATTPCLADRTSVAGSRSSAECQ